MDNEKVVIEQALDFIVNSLKKDTVTLSHIVEDGRINSVKNEDEVIDKIKSSKKISLYLQANSLKIGTPKSREWFDFTIESEDTSANNYFCPVNIKVSKLGTADNLNCKLGIFYALTGCIPSSVSLNNGVGWEKFFKSTDKHMAKNKDKDYCFLVVNKNDITDVFWNSLKRLNKIVPNGNNPPFQCKWSDNKTKTERTYIEARKFILSCLEQTVYQREQIGISFRKYLKKYIDATTDLVSDSTAKDGDNI